MTDKLNDDQKSGILQQVPAGRMGEADEIAARFYTLPVPRQAMSRAQHCT